MLEKAALTVQKISALRQNPAWLLDLNAHLGALESVLKLLPTATAESSGGGDGGGDGGDDDDEEETLEYDFPVLGKELEQAALAVSAQQRASLEVALDTARAAVDKAGRIYEKFRRFKITLILRKWDHTSAIKASPKPGVRVFFDVYKDTMAPLNYDKLLTSDGEGPPPQPVVEDLRRFIREVYAILWSRDDAKGQKSELGTRGRKALHTILGLRKSRWARARLIIVGEGRVGKTSILRRLKNQKPRRNEQSTTIEVTELVKTTVEQRSPIVEQQPPIVEVVAWNEVHDHTAKNEINHNLTAHAIEVRSRPAQACSDEKYTDTLAKVSSSDNLRAMREGQERAKGARSGISSRRKKHGRNAHSADAWGDLACPTLLSCDKEVLSAVSAATAPRQRVVWNESGDNENEKVHNLTVSVWDYGGQKVFHSLHHLSFTPRGAFIVAFRCTDWVDGVDGKTKLKSMRNLRYWLHTIALTANGAGIFLVGTHCKHLKQPGKQLQQIAKDFDDVLATLQEQLKCATFNVQRCTVKSILSKWKCTDEQLTFWPFDNFEYGQGEDQFIYLRQGIEKSLISCKDFDRKISHAWFEAALEIYDRAHKHGSRIVTVDQVTDLLRRIHARRGEPFLTSEQQETRELLETLAHYGIIIIFKDEEDEPFKDLVFINPQWLLDRMTTIIRHFKWHEDLHHDADAINGVSRNKDLGYDAEEGSQFWIDLTRDGVLYEKLLRGLWRATVCSDSERQQLIELMMDLRLLAKDSYGWKEKRRKKDQGAAEQYERYLVPSVFSRHDILDLGEFAENAKFPIDVYDFGKLFLPSGFFSMLIAGLLAHNKGSRASEVKHSLRYGEAILEIENMCLYLTEDIKNDKIYVAGLQRPNIFKSLLLRFSLDSTPQKPTSKAFAVVRSEVLYLNLVFFSGGLNFNIRRHDENLKFITRPSPDDMKDPDPPDEMSYGDCPAPDQPPPPKVFEKIDDQVLHTLRAKELECWLNGQLGLERKCLEVVMESLKEVKVTSLDDLREKLGKVGVMRRIKRHLTLEKSELKSILDHVRTSPMPLRILVYRALHEELIEVKGDGESLFQEEKDRIEKDQENFIKAVKAPIAFSIRPSDSKDPCEVLRTELLKATSSTPRSQPEKKYEIVHFVAHKPGAQTARFINYELNVFASSDFRHLQKNGNEEACVLLNACDSAMAAELMHHDSQQSDDDPEVWIAWRGAVVKHRLLGDFSFGFYDKYLRDEPKNHVLNNFWKMNSTNSSDSRDSDRNEELVQNSRFVASFVAAIRMVIVKNEGEYPAGEGVPVLYHKYKVEKTNDDQRGEPNTSWSHIMSHEITLAHAPPTILDNVFFGSGASKRPLQIVRNPGPMMKAPATKAVSHRDDSSNGNVIRLDDVSKKLVYDEKWNSLQKEFATFFTLVKDSNLLDSLPVVGNLVAVVKGMIQIYEDVQRAEELAIKLLEECRDTLDIIKGAFAIVELAVEAKKVKDFTKLDVFLGHFKHTVEDHEATLTASLKFLQGYVNQWTHVFDGSSTSNEAEGLKQQLIRGRELMNQKLTQLASATILEQSAVEHKKSNQKLAVWKLSDLVKRVHTNNS